MTAAVSKAATPTRVAAPAAKPGPRRPRRHYVMTDRDGRPLRRCSDCGGTGWDRLDPGFECVGCAGLRFVLSRKWEDR